MTGKETLQRVVLYTALIVFAVFTLIPFAFLTFSAFKTNEAFFTFPFWPTEGAWYTVDPEGFTLSNFTRLFRDTGITGALVNSFFFASVSAVVATLLSAMGGFALAKYRFFGRDFITSLVLTALVVPGALLLAPGYQVIYELGLLDTYGGLILPAAAPAFGVYLFRQAFISGLPSEMLEAGRIDGCGEIRLFFQLGVPMVKPMMGAFILITFLGAWNNFIGPQIILQNADKQPLAVAVAQLQGPYGNENGMIMAATLVAVAPVLALFLMLQKDFIAGLTSGSVKG